MKKKSLAIISSDRRIKDFLVKTIEEVIGNEVNIESYSLDEGIEGPKKADLVLTSGKYILQQVKQVFPTSPIIACKRVISGYNLEQVMMLPKGKKVLVINHPKSVTEETIENLKNLGITHLEYVPYCKGKQIEYNEIDTAVSPGMAHLLSGKNLKIIDIGERTITIQSFTEVLLKLDLSLNYIEVFEKNYIRLLMEAAKKIRRGLTQSERLRKNQTILLNEMEEGILSINEEKQLLISNPAMSRLFGYSSDYLMNENIQEIIKRMEKVEVFQDDLSDTKKSLDSLFTYNNKKIVCNKRTVDIDNERHFIYIFREAARIQKLEQEVRRKLYEKGYVAKHTFDDIWGNNQLIQKIKERALHFARTEETILITGESGTGKELLAQAIHRSSERKDGPFVALNFAAIPENLVESELFGYEEGAFTGAKKGGKPGIFELAHGGTLLLDEIGDASLNMQARLLRVLEEREIMRIGDSKIIPVNVRIIAATNKDLMDDVKKQVFRADLFYRLNVLTLETPSLREYKEEIPSYIQRQLLNKFKVKIQLLPEVVEYFMKYDWPGNMRELRNVSDYMYYSSLGNEWVCVEDIPVYLRKQVESSFYENNKNELNDMKGRLAEQGQLKEIWTVLDIYFRNGAIGRNKVVELMKEKGFSFTEGKAKRYGKFFEKNDLITAGRTKQGSSLTVKGRDVYTFLTSEAGQRI